MEIKYNQGLWTECKSMKEYKHIRKINIVSTDKSMKIRKMLNNKIHVCKTKEIKEYMIQRSYNGFAISQFQYRQLIYHEEHLS